MGTLVGGGDGAVSLVPRDELPLKSGFQVLPRLMAIQQLTGVVYLREPPGRGQSVPGAPGGGRLN